MKTLSNFEKIAKKNKRKRLFQAILFVFLVLMLILATTILPNILLTKKHTEVLDKWLVLTSATGPNISISSNMLSQQISPTRGRLTAERVKDIDGIKVPYETDNIEYSIFGGDVELPSGGNLSHPDIELPVYYTANGLRKVPIFYNINHVYEGQSIAQEIPLTAQMTGEAVEVAVTFDKSYTYREIAELVPDDLKINWLWIGAYSDIDISYLPPENLYGLEPWTLDEDIDPTDKYDELNSGSVRFDTFRKNLQAISDNNWHWAPHVKKQIKSYLSENQTAEEAKFSGIILTGRAENFTQLENTDWIYASSIGQSVEIEPYHQLEK